MKNIYYTYHAQTLLNDCITKDDTVSASELAGARTSTTARHEGQTTTGPPSHRAAATSPTRPLGALVAQRHPFGAEINKNTQSTSITNFVENLGHPNVTPRLHASRPGTW